MTENKKSVINYDELSTNELLENLYNKIKLQSVDFEFRIDLTDIYNEFEQRIIELELIKETTKQFVKDISIFNDITDSKYYLELNELIN